MTEARGAFALILLLQAREVLQRELQQDRGLVPQHLHREALQQLRQPAGISMLILPLVSRGRRPGAALAAFRDPERLALQAASAAPGARRLRGVLAGEQARPREGWQHP
jgi:hypothetical protein